MNQAQLYERVQLLYATEQTENWDEWSSMIIPMYNKGKEEHDDQFSDNFFKSRDFKLVSWEIISTKNVEVPQYIADASRAVAMAMDVTIARNGVEEKVADQTDYWALINGEWYWFWRGWPND
jgi:hypothetical protein